MCFDVRASVSNVSSFFTNKRIDFRLEDSCYYLFRHRLKFRFIIRCTLWRISRRGKETILRTNVSIIVAHPCYHLTRPVFTKATVFRHLPISDLSSSAVFPPLGTPPWKLSFRKTRNERLCTNISDIVVEVLGAWIIILSRSLIFLLDLSSVSQIFRIHLEYYTARFWIVVNGTIEMLLKNCWNTFVTY